MYLYNEAKFKECVHEHFRDEIDKSKDESVCFLEVIFDFEYEFKLEICPVQILFSSVFPSLLHELTLLV